MPPPQVYILQVEAIFAQIRYSHSLTNCYYEYLGCSGKHCKLFRHTLTCTAVIASTIPIAHKTPTLLLIHKPIDCYHTSCANRSQMLSFVDVKL